MAWLPVECVLRNHVNEKKNMKYVFKECYLPEGKSPKLPTLSFKINKNGKRLYIPLEKLLLPKNDRNNNPKYKSGRKLCIHIFNYLNKSISFGNHALRSLYTV